ncbi:hypothetical protein J25TS5_25680 [Paenibacillus faecis]|uniref:hypothetical protein n=1 Tax=Paenibacillus faecis TaxID=862114 RepID=UPI001B2EDCD6|nr:hypothetical protein [Paenibacillus faecis]GIO85636.1 hypothetical protein J25TS5_25680 [Paenibacillus faecis]
MKKMTQTNMRIILPLLSAMLLFGTVASPSWSVLSAAAKTDSGTTKDTAAQQKAMETAKAKIKEITGNDYEVIVTGSDGGTTLLGTKKNKSDQIIVSSKGEANDVFLTFSYTDLNNETKLKEQLDKAWKELFPNDNDPLQYVSVHTFTDLPAEVKASNSKGKISLKDGKLEYGVRYAKEQEIPSDALKAADQVLGRIGKGLTKTGRNLKAVVLRPGEPSVYNFEYTTNKGKVWIGIEEKSLLPVEVSIDDKILSNGTNEDYDTEQKKLNSLDISKLAKAAKQEAKTIMKLDLSGYNVEKYKYRNDVLVFTKKGSPEVQIGFTSKGSFHSYSILKYKNRVPFDFTDPVKL